MVKWGHGFEGIKGNRVDYINGRMGTWRYGFMGHEATAYIYTEYNALSECNQFRADKLPFSLLLLFNFFSFFFSSYFFLFFLFSFIIFFCFII